jgi:hypothetical protein
MAKEKIKFYLPSWHPMTGSIVLFTIVAFIVLFVLEMRSV